MALDPKLLDSLPDTLVDMYGLVEIDILEDMARRLSTYDYFIPAAQHQLQKLQELGGVHSEIIAKLSAMTGKSQQEIVDLLAEAAAKSIEDDIEYYTAADVYKPSQVNTEALHAQLNSGLLQTQQAFKNITGTTANTATKQFENALDRAWTQINVGGMDYTTAIQRAIKDLSQAGIGSIEYKSGRVDNIEVAVRRALVTGANQTAVKTQEALADELNVDLVEVTAHGGARPSHAKWQGKVFSRKGRIKIDGVVYEDLAEATGYGKAGGLCGVHCKHNFHPYIPGAPKAYSSKQLEDYNAENVEYNGEMYTEYEASQIQRGIERKIRSLKRQVSAMEAGGQDAGVQRRALRDTQKAYTDFTKQTGLKKQSARTQIPTGANNITGRAENSKKQNLYNSPIENNKKSDRIKDNTTESRKALLLTREQTEEEAKKLTRKLLDERKLSHNDYKENAPVRAALNRELGYDGKPEVISADEFEKRSAGKTVLYRGVTSNGGKSARDIADEFKYGELWTGRSGGWSYGRGVYFTVDKQQAQTDYAKNNGEIITAFLADDAVVADYRELMEEYLNTGVLQAGAAAKKGYFKIIPDIGAYAALKGYDAIATNGYRKHNYIVLLNRKKIVVKE